MERTNKNQASECRTMKYDCRKICSKKTIRPKTMNFAQQMRKYE